MVVGRPLVGRGARGGINGRRWVTTGWEEEEGRGDDVGGGERCGWRVRVAPGRVGDVEEEDPEPDAPSYTCMLPDEGREGWEVGRGEKGKEVVRCPKLVLSTSVFVKRGARQRRN